MMVGGSFGLVRASITRGRVAGLIAIAAIAAGCGGGGSTGGGYTPPVKTTSAPQGGGSAKATFVITWPQPGTTSSAHKRKPDYLSNSTASVTIAVNGGTPLVVNNPNLGSGATSGTKTTTVAVDAPVGNDTFSVNDYDGAGGLGNLLAANSIGYTIAQDAANTVPITLNGNLAHVVCTAVSPFVTGASGGPFTVTGPSGQLIVLPEDADNNIIISPGVVPTLTLTSTDLTKATTSTTSTPNEFGVNVLVSSTAVALTAAGTNLAGATVSASCSITRLPALYVANHGNGFPPGPESITIYPATATGDATPIATISGANAALNSVQFLAVDAKGDIFATNTGPKAGATFGPTSGYTSIWKPGNQNGNVAPDATIANENTPEGITFDKNGILYILSIDRIEAFPASANGVTAAAIPNRVISGPNADLFSCYGVAVDTNLQVYSACSNVANVFSSTAASNATASEILAPGATSMTFSSMSWLGIATDASNNLFLPAANNNLNLVDILMAANVPSPVPSGTPASTTGTLVPAKGTAFTQPMGMAVDAGGKVYVANYGSNTISIFTSTTTLETGVTTTTLTGADTGLNEPYDVYVI